MTLQFSLGTTAPESVDSACIVVGVYEHGVLSGAAERVDHATDGLIRRQLESGDITGKAGSTSALFAPSGISARRVLVVGLGAQKSFDGAHFQKVNHEAARALGAGFGPAGPGSRTCESYSRPAPARAAGPAGRLSSRRG